METLGAFVLRRQPAGRTYLNLSKTISLGVDKLAIDPYNTIMKITIRKAKVSEIAQSLLDNKLYLLGGPNKKNFAKALKKKFDVDDMFVAVDGEVPVGWAYRKGIEVQRFTKLRYRGKGISRRLMAKLMGKDVQAEFKLPREEQIGIYKNKWVKF